MAARKILIVDDETDTLELYSRILSSEPYDMLTVSSSKKAAQLIEDEDWDLLISDIVMPGLDGFDLFEKARSKTDGMKMIAVTGYGSDKILKKVLEYNCFGYINKPFDWDYLKLLIKKALG